MTSPNRSPMMAAVALLAQALAGVWFVIPFDSAVLGDDKPFVRLKFVGSATCSAVGCHGGAGLKHPKGSEYSIWAQQDAHSRAFTLLSEEPSRRMAGRLGLAAAHEAKQCLSCHSTTVTPRDGVLSTEGVTCESCHGPAEKWLTQHVRKDWVTVSPDQRKELGFRDTRSLSSRANLCADCHVGSQLNGREVNHDLIAAGHPRLRFELNSYLANMPAHWDRQADRNRLVVAGSDKFTAPETQVWAVGQLVAASRTASLLAPRDGDEASPLALDFAHIDCHACHHELQAPNWRQEFRAPGQRLGTPSIGRWYFGLLGFIETVEPDGSRRSPALELTPLRPSLHGHSKSSHFGNTSKAWSTTAANLDRWRSDISRRDWTRTDVLRLMNGLAVEGAQLSARTWESTSQLYLAMVAVTSDLRENRNQLDDFSRLAAEATDEALEVIRQRLEFPGEPLPFDSPRDFDTDRVKTIHEQFARIRQAWSHTTAERKR
ncbi:MAG: hypothetical protein HZA46_17045 [Planctomycetales bacterium]|nr:hypothetical protein [Planctomycetales bacterium]